MAKAAKKHNGEAATHAPAGSESVTGEGSHRLISNGDGTARAVPIVNGHGEYPPRPEE